MDLYNKPIASLAILIDNDPKWRPKVFRESLWDSWIGMEFPILKIIDYEARRAELEVSTNRFAPVILAQLAVNQHRDPNARLGIKTALTRDLYRKGWSRGDILSLYRFIDWLVMLPEELELTYTENVMKIEEELKVHYITTAERVGIRKGLQQGLEQGREEGLEQGVHLGESAVLLRQLERKFNVLSDGYRKKIQEADSATLLEWAVRLLDSPSLEALFEG